MVDVKRQTGGTQVFDAAHLSLSVLFAMQPECARLHNGGGSRKDLTRIGTLWTITRAPVPAFPLL